MRLLVPNRANQRKIRNRRTDQLKSGGGVLHSNVGVWHREHPGCCWWNRSCLVLGRSVYERMIMMAFMLTDVPCRKPPPP
jgi:hypothetical protein